MPAEVVSSSDAGVRRSKRVTRPPVWMKDFIGTINTSQMVEYSGSTPPTFPYHISHTLSKPYVAYLMNVHMATEPKNYHEA